MIEAWITTEFNEVRLIFKQEDYEKVMLCKEKTQLHFNVRGSDTDYCWVHECDIPIFIYAVTCIYNLKIS